MLYIYSVIMWDNQSLLLGQYQQGFIDFPQTTSLVKTISCNNFSPLPHFHIAKWTPLVATMLFPWGETVHLLLCLLMAFLGTNVTIADPSKTTPTLAQTMHVVKVTITATISKTVLMNKRA